MADGVGEVDDTSKFSVKCKKKAVGEASEEGGRLIAASVSGQRAEADSHDSKGGAVEAGEAALMEPAQAL